MKKSKQKPRINDELAQDDAQQSPARRSSLRRRSQIHFPEPSLTQQQFKASVDVNNIVKHYAQTGIDPYESRRNSMQFGDATAKSFSEAMFHVAEVHSAFAELPAAERATHLNDPERWLAHMQEVALTNTEIVDSEASQSVSEDVEPSDPASESIEADPLDIT